MTALATEPVKLMEQACTGCHSLDLISAKRATTNEWSEVVKTMIEKGASLKPGEAGALVEYLAATYPKPSDARGKKLVQSVCTLCHEFARVSGAAFTREQWAGEIRGMLEEGAPLTSEEFDVVLDYLAKTYGVKEAQ